MVGRFMRRPKVQMTCWWIGDVERASETLEARGRRCTQGNILVFYLIQHEIDFVMSEFKPVHKLVQG